LLLPTLGGLLLDLGGVVAEALGDLGQGGGAVRRPLDGEHVLDRVVVRRALALVML
jgi:hypothetical protein